MDHFRAHSNEPSHSIKGGDFLTILANIRSSRSSLLDGTIFAESDNTQNLSEAVKIQEPPAGLCANSCLQYPDV
jgi:hypothetical protein